MKRETYSCTSMYRFPIYPHIYMTIIQVNSSRMIFVNSITPTLGSASYGPAPHQETPNRLSKSCLLCFEHFVRYSDRVTREYLCHLPLSAAFLHVQLYPKHKMAVEDCPRSAQHLGKAPQNVVPHRRTSPARRRFTLASRQEVVRSSD